MKNDKNLNLTRVKGGYLGAGCNFESVGFFYFMNIYNPKRIPSDIVKRCLEELENKMLQLEVKKQNCTDKNLIPSINYEMQKIALQELYYLECKKLYEKGIKK